MTIPAIPSGSISVATYTETIKVKAYITNDISKFAWNTVTITIKHECSTASFNSPIPNPITATYSVTSSPSAATS